MEIEYISPATGAAIGPKSTCTPDHPVHTGWSGLHAETGHQIDLAGFNNGDRMVQCVLTGASGGHTGPFGKLQHLAIGSTMQTGAGEVVDPIIRS